MPIAAIIGLLATYGPGAVQLVTKLIALFESGSSVTSAQWATLIADLKVTAVDRLKAELTKQGVDLTSPLAVSLIAQAS